MFRAALHFAEKDYHNGDIVLITEHKNIYIKDSILWFMSYLLYLLFNIVLVYISFHMHLLQL